MAASVKKAFQRIFPIIFMTGCFSAGNLPVKPAKKNVEPQFLSKKNEMNVPDSFISNMLAQYPQFFNAITSDRQKYKIQVIYTQIDRGKKGKVKFTDHSFNLDSSNYFYPASTVKLPVAILALQKLNELNISGLDKNTSLITDSAYSENAILNEPTSADGRPTIAHYIKEVFMVSNNDANNRLYEFAGQEYINKELKNKFYDRQKKKIIVLFQPAEERLVTMTIWNG